MQFRQVFKYYAPYTHAARTSGDCCDAVEYNGNQREDDGLDKIMVYKKERKHWHDSNLSCYSMENS